MENQPRILYCHCAYSKIIPPAVKSEVLEKLACSGVSFEALPDLCEMSARRDPKLKELAGSGSLKILACYPRAVQGLFLAAGSPLAEGQAEILNMRTGTSEELLSAVLVSGETG